MSANDTLSYDVFVSEPIRQNGAGLLPNGERHMFSPLSTTLIYGKNDAVLVDPPLTIDQAKAVSDWVEASGKKLTHIFATHGHGYHWFTAGVLAGRFGPQVVASAGTIEQMRFHLSIREVFWDKLWPGQIPPSPVTAVTVPDNRFTLEGHDLVIIEVGHSDTDESTVLHVPDLGLVVAGDVIYNGVHQYLDDVDDLLPKNSSARDFFNAMLQRYPNRRLGATTLWAGTRSLYALRDRRGGEVLHESLAGWL